MVEYEPVPFRAEAAKDSEEYSFRGDFAIQLLFSLRMDQVKMEKFALHIDPS